MKYEEMNVFEINKKVAQITNQRVYEIKEGMGLILISLDEQCHEIDDYNPCNNPSDAWPIIVESGISLTYDKECRDWNAYSDFEGGFDRDCNQTFEYNIMVWNSNPLRAAMICFLKMKDAESDQ